MKFAASAILAALIFTSAALHAQDATPQRSNGGQGRGGRGFGAGPMGRGIGGTVTAITTNSITVKTETGELYTVHFSANTRILKQVPRPAGQAQSPNQDQAQSADNQPGAASTRGGGNGGRDGFDNAPGGRGRRGGAPPIEIKATDIHVGDTVMAAGDIDDSAKSVGAVMIMQLDPEGARQLRELQANFGKTWLMGRVTAVNETKVTINSNVDNAAHAFVADENTTFRKRRDPITLADVAVGDMIRVEGAVKAGTFVATSVAVVGQPGQRPQGSPAPQQ